VKHWKLLYLTAEEFIAEMNARLREAGFSSPESFCSIDTTSGKFSFLFAGATPVISKVINIIGILF